MKIAMVVPALEPKAPVLVANELSEGLLRLGHDVTILHMGRVNELETVVPVRRLNFSGVRQLKDYDVVHSHMLRPDAALAWARILRIQGPVILTTIHNYVEEDLNNTHGAFVSKVFSALWRFFWARLDARVVLSGDAVKYYEVRQPNLAFEYIPNGRTKHFSGQVHVADIEIIRGKGSGKIIIGANALLSPRKGLEQVIKALPDLPGYVFVVVGDGPIMCDLRKLAEQLKVAERFVCLGLRHNARDYLDFYDVYMMASRSEGMPLAVLEAAAAGKSIVCSRIPVLLEMFDESQASFFDLDDTEGLVGAIKRAYEKKEALGKAALEKFEDNYQQDSVVNKYSELYKKLVRQKEDGLLLAAR